MNTYTYICAQTYPILDYLYSRLSEPYTRRNYEVKVQQGPCGHDRARAGAAYASRMQPPCVQVLEFILFDNTQSSAMATGTSRKRKQIVLSRMITNSVIRTFYLSDYERQRFRRWPNGFR